MKRGTAFGGRRIGRCESQIGLVVLAACLGACLLAATPAVAKHHGPRRLSLSFKSKTQSDQGLLSAGRVDVVVRSPRKRKLVLAVRGFGGGPALTDPARVSAKAGKKKKVSLPLSTAGREVLQGCGADGLLLTAKSAHKPAKKRKKGKSPKGRATLTKSVPQCASLARADRCEIIASPGTNCLFPFPSDHYTVPDSSTPTGLRVNINAASTPANKGGVHINPEGINASDGFSPGESIVTRVPGLDNPQAFQNTGAVPLTDMDRAFDAGQPIVLIDASTGQRQLVFSELDSTATSPENTDLIIRPGRNLIEGHRYIVALRNLKDASGAIIPAPPGFALYRDGVKTDVAGIEQRRAHFEDIFSRLQSAGISRDDLYDAWDFTVASTQNVTQRMLSIRDRGLADLGDTTPGDGTMQGSAPDFTITDVTDFPTATGHGVQNIREVTGTYQVPCFLDSPGCVPGGRFTLGPDGLPVRTPGNFQTARFTCNIPRSAVTETSPGVFDVDHQVRPSMYGHGLFGDYTEVHTTNVRQLGTDEGVLTCATDWTGMMEDDVPTAISALQDLSKFQPLPDGLQQGFLNFIYLGRLLMLPDGFSSSAAFQFSGHSVIDHSQGLYYYGNSQGGIAGGALTAVEPDITRTVLYVPGMNYSTLLTRSVDFEDYSLVLYPSYPNESERPLLLALIQMMWDRGEPNGYANHMTSDPLPGTPAHHVLIEMAYGDHQVSNVATEVEARTIGAPLRYPTLDPGRTPGFVNFFPDIPPLGDLSGAAADGNGMFVWDIGPKRDDGMGGVLGTDPAPITNTAPDDSFGVDPHDTVINTSPLIRHQIAEFLKPDGKIIDPCGTDPCYAAGWSGPP
ncbi:MAG TPA: hypothetical protein VLB79_03970 [Solirubrobacterales bacterium]|nr:hypothetical protein [Solirubrobacterales bacterium]